MKYDTLTIVAVLCLVGFFIWIVSSDNDKKRSGRGKAYLKWAKVGYWKERDGYKALIHFSGDLSDVSAIHIHREKNSGGVGPIIAWLATSKEWQNGPIQGQPKSNSMCCVGSHCTLQAPDTTPLVHTMAGKTLEMEIPYHTLGTSCDAMQHLKDRKVYLVVHGKKLTPQNPLDILGHVKFS